MRRGLAITIVCAASLAAVLPLQQVSYACTITGQVSSECCCKPAEDGACPVIENHCQCCDVTVTEGEIDEALPAGTNSFGKHLVAQTPALEWASADDPLVANRAAAQRCARFAAFAPPVPTYLLILSFRC